MEPNNRNNRNRGDKNRRRGGGMWSIVLWALLLTIGVNYLSVMLDQARTAESSCEIAYSELVELVEEGKVKSIEFGDTVFTITPVDGFTYTDDDGKSYDQNYTLFTTIIPDATEKLITLCDEHGVTYTKPYQPPVSPILTFMVSYILPTVLMVGAFMLLMNFITKKSGGMGGIGGIGNVGKANAKVYMEKSTGVTFADVAGQDEAKESLVEIIDFLHNPQKYTDIGAKLPRLAGLDMVIGLTPYGKFPMMMDTFVNMGIQMLAPLGHIKPVFPMPGGGTTQGHIEDVIHKFGKDVMIAAGGAIHGHPMGPAAGARAFRQGIDAVCAGKSLEEAGTEYEELGVALKLWGIYSEAKHGIFDLKG